VESINGVDFLSVTPLGNVVLGNQNNQFEEGHIDALFAAEGLEVAGAGSATGGLITTPDIAVQDSLDVNGTATFRPSSQTYGIEVEPVSGGDGTTIRPDTDNRCELGAGDGTTADYAFGQVHTHNLYEYSPAPLDPADPRGPPSDAGPANANANAQGPPIDLDAVGDHSWGDPPAYVSQRKRPDGTHEQLDDGAVEMGHLLNYVWELSKAQQKRIDALEQQLSGRGGN